MGKFNLMNYLLPPKNEVFYDLFEKCTEVSMQSAKLLNDILTTNISDEYIVQAKELKKESATILRETFKKLNSTFVTPMEPEDIQKIISLINKITKRIVRVCLNLNLYNIEVFNDDMKKHGIELLKATNELHSMIKTVKKVPQIKKITASNLQMKKIEMRGDEIINSAIKDLFSGNFETIDVIKLKDIYKDMEVALDSCYAVSDEIMNIILRQG